MPTILHYRARGWCDADIDQPGKQKKISTRAYEIDKTISYSDLFFDSLELEKQITARSIKPRTARRMRSFYNTRNYQFAWFASDGFTEQANAFWNLYDYYITYSGDSTLNDGELQRTMNALVLEEDLEGKCLPFFYQNRTGSHTTLHRIRTKNFEKGYVKRKEMEAFCSHQKKWCIASRRFFID